MSVPRLHVVTDDEIVHTESWLVAAHGILEAGGARVALHVRAPRASGASVFEWCRALQPTAESSGAMLLVNDRVDVASALGLGVHLGRRSLEVADARRVTGAGARIGVSCHSPGEAGHAADSGADYLFAGSVFSTPSHAGVAGMGVVGMRRLIASAVDVPVLAIGGITVERVAEVVRAGAHGVAVIRGVWGADDSRGAAVGYISALGNTKEVE